MERRTFLKSLAAVSVVGMGTVGAGTALSSAPMRRGTVQAKSITAKTGDGVVGVLLAQPDGITVEDGEFDDAFAGAERVTVTEETHERLRSAYSEVYYNVHVEHVPIYGTDGETVTENLAYRTDRQAFNALDVGETATYRIDDGDVPRIESVTDAEN